MTSKLKQSHKSGNSKHKQDAFYPEIYLQNEKKYQNMNRFLNDLKINPSLTLEKIKAQKISNKQPIYMIPNHKIYNFQIDNKIIEQETTKVKKEQSRSEEDNILKQENHQDQL